MRKVLRLWHKLMQKILLIGTAFRRAVTIQHGLSFLEGFTTGVLHPENVKRIACVKGSGSVASVKYVNYLERPLKAVTVLSCIIMGRLVSSSVGDTYVLGMPCS